VYNTDVSWTFPERQCTHLLFALPWFAGFTVGIH
jgi:hypothetical protein